MDAQNNHFEHLQTQAGMLENQGEGCAVSVQDNGRGKRSCQNAVLCSERYIKGTGTYLA